MNLKSIQECERTKLEKFLSKFQLPHIYKKIGIGTVVLSFILLTVIKFTDNEPSWMRLSLKHLMIVGLLVISISREKIEDELIESLRSKSYALAFIIGVIYTMLQPAVNYVADLIIDSQEEIGNIYYFEVLLFMLLIQVMFFEVLKRNR
ncbi:hypothetical protein L3X39_12210 [Sabulilitoribacter multivorans]|uniref:Uncharacterized protein n=1 Tax=Flaviramulus multivorans TaxID=1304750 RepID=A0ABS9ILB8_9FLAO|nr:hypothetical protein [Flaviramulus multivorans]MCF7561403.1 hypothetical protein [Flaviramulus multivorans]